MENGIKVGNDFVAHRKDGRIISGQVVTVGEYASKGILVVVRIGNAHKSVYLSDCVSYHGG